ncbi:hypothetical protein GNP80_08850 [Aliivibrio fischeri]|uniref:TrbI/VirB10 family protein n=1 Tax=Aliivibrio fischeri TaxID=668 RepID=UPI0012D9F11E|nr:TrbI/VirB10 family protein [Aliivibrio fischeri]MUK92549.1 hypothetical protein [Aliivibrio fischeri]
MASLDELQKGNLTPAVSYLKIGGLIFLFTMIATVIVIGYLHLSKDSIEPANAEAIDIASSHLPESYFPAFNNVSDNKERSEREDIKERDLKFKEATVISVANGGVAPTGKAIEVEKPSEPEKQKKTQELTAEEALLKKQLDQLKELQEQRRLLLLSRRGKKAGEWQSVSLIPTIKNPKKEPKSPSSEDFSEHEIDKDISTFPVDLSRTVTADRYIPCILVDQINSQLEGRATCSVETNIYGFHGRNILIPAGSRLMGSHGTLKRVGDERFNILWTRLLRPDGVHIKLTDAYSSDAIGGTGVVGEVNRRNWEKYGGAILTSTVSVLAQMSIPTEGTSISNSVMESYSTDLGRVTASMLQENINIKPYSVVPAGRRILVTPVTDIWLKKEKNTLSFEAINSENK